MTKIFNIMIEKEIKITKYLIITVKNEKLKIFKKYI